MKKAQPLWVEGVVNERKEFYELRNGKGEFPPFEEWKPIVRVAKSTKNEFFVEWLVSKDTSEHKAMITKAIHSLDNLLVDAHVVDPWSYLQWYISTSANIYYSSIRWCYFPTGIQSGGKISK